MRRRLFSAALGASAWATLAAPARAVERAGAWPQRPVHIVVMFPAGGVADQIARVAADELSRSLGQAFVVENKPGANGQIAAEHVARAAPDGHTLLLASDAAISINPLIYASLRYRPAEDFAPISLLAAAPVYLFVNGSVPATDLPGFITRLRAEPGRYNYGSYGLGSSPHLLTERFKQLTQTELVHVPYKGIADALPALLANQIQVLMTLQGPTPPHVRSGALKALAAFTPRRQPSFPDVPTAAEQGLELEGGGWFGLMAPSGTPAEPIGRLASELGRVTQLPVFRQKIVEAYGLEAVGGTPAGFARQLQRDQVRYAAMVRAAGVRLDRL